MAGFSRTLIPHRLRRRLPDSDVWSLDHVPLIKLFSPIGIATWLVSAADGDILYALCDFGNGRPSMGAMSLHYLSRAGDRSSDRLRRDRWFSSAEPLSTWFRVARRTGSIAAAEIELRSAGPSLALRRCDYLEAMTAPASASAQ